MVTETYFAVVLNKILLLLFGIFLGWFANSYLNNMAVKIEIKPPDYNTKNKEKIQIKKAKSVKNKTNKPLKTEKKDIYSPDFLMTKSKIYVKKGEYLKALDVIETLLAQVQDKYPQQFVEDLFFDISKDYLEELGEGEQQQKIYFLYRAVNILPNHLEFRYLLGDLLLVLEDYDGAEYQLNFLANSTKWKKQFNELKHKIDYAKIFNKGSIKIPLINKNNGWLLKAKVNNSEVLLLLDTGASISLLAADATYGDKLEKINLSTANGLVETYKIKLEEFIIGSVIKNNFIVAVLPKEKLPQGVDGLLGTDWLQDFNFVIDKKNLSLNLTSIIQ